MEFETFLEFERNINPDTDFEDPEFWRNYYSQDWSSIISLNMFGYGCGDPLALGFILDVTKSKVEGEYLFSLEYSRRDADNKYGGRCHYISVGDGGLTTEKIFYEYDITSLKGSFVDVSIAISTIFSFLKDPTKLPETVLWEDRDEAYRNVPPDP